MYLNLFLLLLGVKMVTYEIHTEKFKFGDNAFEKSLEKFGLEIKRIKTDGENLIYEVEREDDLSVSQKHEISHMNGVSTVAIAD